MSTRVYYSGDGSQTDFSIPFFYQQKSEVIVRLNGSTTSAFTWSNDFLIRMNSAPAAGAVIQITRRTGLGAKTVYVDGVVDLAADRNLIEQQELYIGAEAYDFAAEDLGLDPVTGITFTARNQRITHLADPIDGNDAVHYQWMNTHTVSLLSPGVFTAAGFRITGVGDPSAASDAVNYQWMNTHTVSLLSPGVFTAAGFRITGVGDPLIHSDAVNAQWMDTHTVSLLSPGVFTAAGARISNIGAPVGPYDAVNVSYVAGLLADFIVAAPVSNLVVLTPEMFGAVGDGVLLPNDASMTGPSPVITSASGRFTLDMVNKPICVKGAGVGGGVLRTTVASFIDAHHMLLAAGATITVSATNVAIGADNTAAFSALGAAIQAAGDGTNVMFGKAKTYLINATGSWSGALNIMILVNVNDISIDFNGSLVADCHYYDPLAGSGDACYFLIVEGSGSGYYLKNFKGTQVQEVTPTTLHPGGFALITVAQTPTDFTIINPQVFGCQSAFQCLESFPSTLPNKASNITIIGGHAINSLYGVLFGNNGDNVTVTNFDTDGSHRSYFVYGAENHDVSIRSRNSTSNDVLIATGGYTGAVVPTRNIRLNYMGRAISAGLVDTPGPSLITLQAFGGGSGGPITGGVFDNIHINLDVDCSTQGPSQGMTSQMAIVLFMKTLTTSLSTVWRDISISGRISGVQSLSGPLIDLFRAADAPWSGETVQGLRIENLIIDGSNTPDFRVDLAPIDTSSPLVLEGLHMPMPITTVNNAVAKVIQRNNWVNNAQYVGDVAFSYNSSGAADVNWYYDNSVSQTMALANGANKTLATGSGLIIVTNTVTRDTAVFALGGGAVVLIASTLATWQATTTPASGKSSIGFSGGNYVVYNNTGGSLTCMFNSMRSFATN